MSKSTSRPMQNSHHITTTDYRVRSVLYSHNFNLSKISSKNKGKETGKLGKCFWILQTSQGFLRSVAKNNTVPTSRINQILSFTAKINKK